MKRVVLLVVQSVIVVLAVSQAQEVDQEIHKSTINDLNKSLSAAVFHSIVDENTNLSNISSTLLTPGVEPNKDSEKLIVQETSDVPIISEDSSPNSFQANDTHIPGSKVEDDEQVVPAIHSHPSLLESNTTSNISNSSKFSDNKSKGTDFSNTWDHIEIFEVTQYLPQTENSDSVNNVDSDVPANDEQTIIDQLTRISDRVKSFSNEAMVAWEDVKEQAEQASEATHVLSDYLDKITISQSANNTECVRHDMERYQERKTRLREIATGCESSVNRESWKRLQTKTKQVLKQINQIKQNITKTTAETKNHFDEKKIKTDTNNKLQLEIHNLEEDEEELSRLKSMCLKEDEDELNNCIKVETNKGMIVDTLNDIMRIKNNCVG